MAWSFRKSVDETLTVWQTGLGMPRKITVFYMTKASNINVHKRMSKRALLGCYLLKRCYPGCPAHVDDSKASTYTDDEIMRRLFF